MFWASFTSNFKRKLSILEGKLDAKVKDLNFAIINAYDNITLDELKSFVNSIPNKTFELIRKNRTKMSY